MSELGRWMEEYEHCSHTFVARVKPNLPGYCRHCGTDRKLVYYLPAPGCPCGHSEDGDEPKGERDD